MRNELVDGQGNFGSVNDDPAAGDEVLRGRYPGCKHRQGPSESRISRAVSSRTVSARSISPSSTGLGRPVHASRVFHSGEHPTLKVRTREGFELTGTHNHPVLCLRGHGGRAVASLEAPGRAGQGRPRSGQPHTENARQGAESVPSARWRCCWVHLCPRAGRRADRAGFNNIDPEFFQTVLSAYDKRVGGARYVSQRNIRSGSLLFELDVQNLSLLPGEPARIPACHAQRGQAGARGCMAGARRHSSGRFSRRSSPGDGSSSLLPRSTIQVSYSSYSEQLCTRRSASPAGVRDRKSSLQADASW